MQLFYRSSTRRFASALALVAVVGCTGNVSDPVAPSPAAGTYVATQFLVTPDGAVAPIDVLSAGGSLTVTVNADKSVSGTLHVPANVLGSEFTTSMAGTLVVGGGGVEFQQAANSFVRALTWTVGTNWFTVVNQHAGTASYTITLTRQ